MLSTAGSAVSGSCAQTNTTAGPSRCTALASALAGRLAPRIRAPIRRSARAAATPHRTRECISSGRAGQQDRAVVHRRCRRSHLAGERVLHGGAEGMLDLDAAPAVAPLLAHAVEHGHEQVVPRPEHAAALDGLGDDGSRSPRCRGPGPRGPGREPPGPRRAWHDPPAAGPGLRLDVGGGHRHRELGDGRERGVVDRHLSRGPGRLGGRDPGDHQPAHVLQAGQVGGAVATVRPGPVLARDRPRSGGPRCAGWRGPRPCAGPRRRPSGRWPRRAPAPRRHSSRRHCGGSRAEARPETCFAPKIIQLNYLTNL